MKLTAIIGNPNCKQFMDDLTVHRCGSGGIIHIADEFEEDELIEPLSDMVGLAPESSEIRLYVYERLERDDLCGLIDNIAGYCNLNRLTTFEVWVYTGLTFILRAKM